MIAFGKFEMFEKPVIYLDTHKHRQEKSVTFVLRLIGISAVNRNGNVLI